MVASLLGIPGKVKIIENKLTDLRGQNLDNADTLLSNVGIRSVQAGQYIPSYNLVGVSGIFSTSNDLTISAIIDIQKAFISFYITELNNYSSIIQPQLTLEIINTTTLRVKTTFWNFSALVGLYPIGLINWAIIEFK
jgi:hypothetical protein